MRGAGYQSVSEGLKDLGLDSVEVEYFRDYTVYRPDGWQKISFDGAKAAAAIGGAYRSAGIKICAFLLHNNFNCADQAAEINWVIDVVRTAESLGIKAIRVDAITKGEKEEPFETRVTRFVECMKKVLTATEGSSVQLGIENHGVQGNDPAFLKQVISRVGSSRLGINMDTGNFYWYGFPVSEVYEVLGSLAKYTKHTHIKNICYPERERERKRECGWEYAKYVSPIPDGDIDHCRVVRLLAVAGYQGPLAIEDESLGRLKTPEEKQAVLKRDVAYLKNLLV